MYVCILALSRAGVRPSHTPVSEPRTAFTVLFQPKRLGTWERKLSEKPLTRLVRCEQLNKARRTERVAVERIGDGGGGASSQSYMPLLEPLVEPRLLAVYHAANHYY